MKNAISVILAIVMALALAACGNAETGGSAEGSSSGESTVSSAYQSQGNDEDNQKLNIVAEDEVPEYEGEAYAYVNDNRPEFEEELKTEDSFEKYGELDDLGRCTDAIANLSIDTQPAATEERGDISSVHPSGWQSDMGWERCHLIGWQLSAENANERNLVTGTHYMNVSGMLPLENKVDDYLERSGNHVLYEVTPYFEGDNPVCSGVFMQAESVEDNGEGISFHVYCFNVNPGREINYATGTVTAKAGQEAEGSSHSRTYILNANTGKFHYPSCSSVSAMSESNKKKVTKSRDELIRDGYSPCGNCNP